MFVMAGGTASQATCQIVFSEREEGFAAKLTLMSLAGDVNETV